MKPGSMAQSAVIAERALATGLRLAANSSARLVSTTVRARSPKVRGAVQAAAQPFPSAAARSEGVGLGREGPGLASSRYTLGMPIKARI